MSDKSSEEKPLPKQEEVDYGELAEIFITLMEIQLDLKKVETNKIKQDVSKNNQEP